MPVRDLLSAASGTGGATDPYFYDVSLLLTGDGTNGAQNNTFLDSSTNNFTITRNGNTTQGSFSPYGNLWGNYFNSGTTDYLTTSGSALPSGTGDFTIQGWIFLSDTTANATKVITSGSATNSLGFRVGQSYHGNINGLGLTRYNAADNEYCSYTFSANTWYHIAVVRKSSVIYFYINGVQQTTQGSGLGSYSLASAGTTYIAGDTNGDEKYNGYISNLQVTNNAVYSSNFTPSTTPLTAVSGTQLLTCQSNRFIDNSSNGLTITPSGTPSVQRFSPFNPTAPYSTSVIGGSGYFNGSGDYLSLANNSALKPTGDFTVECSVYFTASPTGKAIMCFGDDTNTASNITLDVNGSGFLRFFSANSSASNDAVITTSIIPSLNTWYYLCVTRSGNVYTYYVNGTSAGTTTISTARYTSGTFNAIGCQYRSGSYQDNITGYVTDVRLVNGTAIAPSGYPTTPATAVTNTSLLTNFTNAGIPDLAMQNDLQTVGSAQVSTSVKKYGTGSLSFSSGGTGSNYLKSPYSEILGTGNFTIEGWYYLADATTGVANYLCCIGDTHNANGMLFFVYNNAILVYTNNSTILTSSSGLSNNTWTHVAFVRNSGTLTIYLNGTSIGSVSNSSNIFGGITIGAQYDTATYYPYFNGYIDDLRITNGLARYTANFTPPTAALPTY